MTKREKTSTQANLGMIDWRLLKLQVNDAFTNMAIDEAIVTYRIIGSVPNTLRFYKWKPSAVSIGRFQDVNTQVQMDNCQRLGVDIVRRISGGGTVYHDDVNEITYSVIAREEDFGTKAFFQIYKIISEGLIQAAKILGVSADFAPGNSRNCPNVAIQGKKISGNAQFHRGNVVLQHGTFLLDVDFKKMFTLLRVQSVKTHQDAICKAQEKITSIKKELGKEVTTEEAYEALIEGFVRVFGRQLKEGRLTVYEQILAQQLREDKFSTEEWNLGGKFNPKPKHL